MSIRTQPERDGTAQAPATGADATPNPFLQWFALFIPVLQAEREEALWIGTGQTALLCSCISQLFVALCQCETFCRALFKAECPDESCFLGNISLFAWVSLFPGALSDLSGSWGSAQSLLSLQLHFTSAGSDASLGYLKTGARQN